MCKSQSFCGTKKLLLVVLAVGVTTVSVVVVVVVVGTTQKSYAWSYHGGDDAWSRVSGVVSMGFYGTVQYVIGLVNSFHKTIVKHLIEMFF